MAHSFNLPFVGPMPEQERLIPWQPTLVVPPSPFDTSMPFMDDGHGVSPTFGGSLPDDLFNDPQSALPGSEQAVGPYIATVHKIDQLAVNGACQRIAWSPNGMLAEITDDGRNVNLRTLTRPPGKTIFELTGPEKLDLPPNRFVLPLTHVSWSPINGTSMLGVIDLSGHFALYTASPIACRLNKTALMTFDGQNANGGCVAMHWLRSKMVREHPAKLGSHAKGEFEPNPGPVKFAWKMANAWSYSTTSDKQVGPATVSGGLHAFLTVTRDSLIRFCFQQLNASWQNVDATLAPCDSLEDMLSHASIAAYKDDSVLIATLSLKSTLRTYEVRVDWGADLDPKGQLRPGSQLGPTLIVQCLKIVEGFGSSQSISLSETRTQPCHLICLPRALEGYAPPPAEPPVAGPSIITIHSSITQSHNGSTTRNFSSRLVLNKVKESNETLHSAFTSMAARRGKSLNTTTRPIITLPKEADIDIPGIVVAVHLTRADTMLVILTNDGCCRLFDRMSNSLLDCDITTERIRNPLQTVFSFSAEDKGDFLDSTFSPNGTMIAKCEDDGSVSVKEMDDLSTEPEGRTAAGITMVSASSCFVGNSNEDTLARTWQLQNKFEAQHLARELVKAIGVSFDFVGEDPSTQHRMSPFLLNPIVTKTLGFIESIDASKNGTKSVPSRVANVLVDLRSMCVSVQMALSSPPEQLSTYDACACLQGLLDWTNTLIAFLVDEVLDIQRKLRSKGNPEPTLDFIAEFTRERNSPAVTLLLASTPRMLLRIACRFWRSLTGKDSKIATTVPPQYLPSWRTICNTTADAPVDLRHFETFLVGINHYAQETYENSNIQGEDRKKMEGEFLVTGEVPEVLTPLAKRLVTGSIDRLVDESKLDCLRLFKMDVRSLGLTDDASTAQWWRGRKRCTLRKIDLSPSLKRWRRCARCERVTEDFSDPRATPPWIAKMQRFCLCGGLWIGVEK